MKRTLVKIEKRIIAIPFKPARIILYGLYIPVLMAIAVVKHASNSVNY